MKTKFVITSAALLTVGLAATYFLSESVSDQPQSGRQHNNATIAIPAQLPGQQRADTPGADALALMTQRLGNQVERGENLRALYEQFKHSRDGVERNMAYRAWSACFPTFVAPEGQVMTIESIAQGLPPNDPQSDKRIEAYRGLQARCRGFSDMTRDEALTATRNQQEAWKKGDALSPGEIAAKLLSDGNTERALAAARSIIASKDPYAINSMREFINQYLVLQVDAQTAHSNERPDLRALAFAIVACQTGLECGAGSLTALQQCANTGECAGSVVDRYLHALPSQADRDAVMKESARVAEAIRTGNTQALGLASPR